MSEMQKARLSDILNYEPDKYLSDDELALIRNTFSDKKVIRVLRKIMLPSVGDPDMPLEELGNDTWLLGVDWTQVQADQAKPIAVGRQEAIKFVMGGLIKLRMIANQKPETPEEAALRNKQNSNK